MNIFKRTENWFTRIFESAGEQVILLFQTLFDIKDAYFRRDKVFKEMLKMGYNSLPLASMIIFFTGMVVALQTGIVLRRYGSEQLIGSIVALSMVKEMGPVITSIIVSGRVGSAMAAEIGNMSVSEEIDSLRMMGISPISYLAMPRLVGSMTMLPILIGYAIIIGIIGGGVVTVSYLKVGVMLYYKQVMRSILLGDIARALVKAFIFGIIISNSSCYSGFKTQYGTADVGQSTTRAVVLSFSLILILDFFLTRFLG